MSAGMAIFFMNSDKVSKGRRNINLTVFTLDRLNPLNPGLLFKILILILLCYPIVKITVRMS